MDQRRKDQTRQQTARPPQVLGHALIQRALDKSSDGTSLDFVDQNITEVPPAAIDELASVGQEFAGDEGTIHRIAFAKNKIKDLPSNFATLTRLRYLNLRMNALSRFPPVLSAMPWLEILDLSRNYISSFPENPGSLLSLRVLHIGRNRITSLPQYFPDFRDLSLFKVADNPITWPPNHIINGPEDSTKQREVQEWIENIKRWMLEHSDVSGPLSGLLTQESSSPPPEVDLTSDDEKVSVRSYTSSRAHFRNPSIDSVGSHYSTTSGPQSGASSPRRPQGLRTLSESPSPEIPIDTPQISLEDQIDALAKHLHGQHGRNASYSVSLLHSPVHGLSLKKSLPELRTFQLSADNRSRSRAPALNGNDAPSLPNARPSNSSATSSNDTIRKAPGRVLQESPRASPLPAMDGERNRYFKRLSTLPASTISKAVPASLLNTIDACRGILFALSQIYTSLHHYAVYAINDRLASVIWKVLYAAPNFLQTLIGALDRFDNHCLRGTPPPSACRGVLEACRDCVSVFTKVVGVLQIHLKVLAGADDVRYSRTLLLMLYGSMAEISNSWQSMAPHMEAMTALAKDAHPLNPPSPVTSGGSGSPSMDAARAAVRDIRTIAETEEAGVGGPASATTPTHRIGPPPARVARSNNRRHAGSFSTKDVRMGRSMPMGLTASAGGVAPLSINPPSLVPLNLRSGLRNPTGLSSPGPPSASSSTLSPAHPHGPPPALTHHSNHSQSSEIHSREGSLGQLYNIHNPPHSAGSDKDRFVNGSTLSLLQESTELAVDLWEQVEVLFDDPRASEVVGSTGKDYLHRAQNVTAKLREGVTALVDGGDEETYGPEIYENASAFGKDVASVAAMLKKAKEYGVSLNPRLVDTLKNLIQCTQEYASLLQFSSFASSGTSRPPLSPAPSGLSNHSYLGSSAPTNTSVHANLAPVPYYETNSGMGNGSSVLPMWKSRNPIGNSSMAGVGTGVGVPFSMIQAQAQVLHKVPASGPPGGRNRHGGSFMGYHTDS